MQFNDLPFYLVSWVARIVIGIEQWLLKQPTKFLLSTNNCFICKRISTVFFYVASVECPVCSFSLTHIPNSHQVYMGDYSLGNATSVDPIRPTF